MLTITLPNGTQRGVTLRKFPALDGFDIQNRFIEFASTKDTAIRRAFTMEVLSYATVIAANGLELPLKTDALIDNHLGSWQNVERVFEAVLAENGIDAQTHAQKASFWEEAGAQMATYFLAEVSKLVSPMLEEIKKA